MKVYKVVEGSNELTAEEKDKIAILKLVSNGQYVDTVGMRQDDYFLLEDTMHDPQMMRLILRSYHRRAKGKAYSTNKKS